MLEFVRNLIRYLLRSQAGPRADCVPYALLLANIVKVIAAKLEREHSVDFLHRIGETVAVCKRYQLGTIDLVGIKQVEKESTCLAGQLELVVQGLKPIDDIGVYVIDDYSIDNLCTMRDLADIAARTTRIVMARELGKARQEYSEGLAWAYAIAERRNDSGLERTIRDLVEDVNLGP